MSKREIHPEIIKSPGQTGELKNEFLESCFVRRKVLIDDFRHEFEGRSVLELGPCGGVFSVALAKYAKKLVLVENDPACVRVLKTLFPKGVKIVHADMHHQLWKFKPGDFDVIVCAGVLYHSASPYFLLEAMAFLRPRRLLLDTLMPQSGGDVELVLQWPLNQMNFRYNHNPDARAAIRLGEKPLDLAMRNLGFCEPAIVAKQSLAPPPELDSHYFQWWKKSYSKWWAAKPGTSDPNGAKGRLTP